MEQVDVLIIGGGAAGLFCGARAAQRGRRVRVLDHSAKPAEKIRISGGGRCNFTNLHTEAKCFVSENPHFAKSALARYTPWDFCGLMAEHDLTWHEKTLGQLFCDQKSGAVIAMLLKELADAGGTLHLETHVHAVEQMESGFRVQTSMGSIETESLVIATGGLSIPKIGASSFAYDIAEQFGHAVIPTRPALVPMTFTDKYRDSFSALSGVSVAVEARAENGPSFVESLLFTHRGLSGPAVLQISTYWHDSEPLHFDLLPGQEAAAWLLDAKARAPKQPLGQLLSTVFPTRFAEMFPAELDLDRQSKLAALSNHQIDQLAQSLKDWRLKPAGTEGWRTAEVTAGGVATEGLSSRTMESKRAPGLFFIGECVDVTGWLGGYNFQWAWASAAAAAENV